MSWQQYMTLKVESYSVSVWGANEGGELIKTTNERNELINYHLPLAHA